MASLEARLNVFRRLNKLLVLILPHETTAVQAAAASKDVEVHPIQLATMAAGVGLYPTLPTPSRHTGYTLCTTHHILTAIMVVFFLSVVDRAVVLCFGRMSCCAFVLAH